MGNELIEEIQLFKEKFLSKIKNANSIAITGHIRPDGDCIGSTIGLYQYIEKNYNVDQSKQVDLFLDASSNSFSYLNAFNKIQTQRDTIKKYDLFVSLDCASIDRLGMSEVLFQNAIDTVNIDHHVSNTVFAHLNHVEAKASSTCEVLSGIFDEDFIDLDIATALYTGIVHDTGVFKHSNTSRRTMELAGMLLEKGVNSSMIIDESFYQKTYVQNQILGRCLLESMMVLSGKVIVSYVTKRQMDFYNAKPYDLEGIIDQLRVTKGVEVAILVHETGECEYKVSMRSNGDVNVSTIATFFGGGGHIKAAGCSMKGSVHDVINNLTLHIENQLKKLQVID